MVPSNPLIHCGLTMFGSIFILRAGANYVRLFFAAIGFVFHFLVLDEAKWRWQDDEAS